MTLNLVKLQPLQTLYRHDIDEAAALLHDSGTIRTYIPVCNMILDLHANERARGMTMAWILARTQLHDHDPIKYAS